MKRVIQHNIAGKSLEELIRYYVDAYSAFFVPSEYHLTEREKQFFIQMVILARKGIDILSSEANLKLKEIFNSKEKDRSIWIYRNKLKGKGWLLQTKDGLVVPNAFSGRFNTVNFDVSVNYEPEEQGGTGGGEVLQGGSERSSVSNNETRSERRTEVPNS